MPLDVVESLCSLVSIPSVNPMGRPHSGDEFFEHAMTARLEQLFNQMRLPYVRQEVAPRRSNIWARLDGSPDSKARDRLLVFEAHQDTVPVEGMTIPPWTPTIRDGRVSGRGACDIKGGMASMLAAVSRLAEERPPEMPTIIMACSVNEEHGFTGASAMAESWARGDNPLVPRAPDAVIVAEPTLLNVVVAHKGVVRWRIRTSGKAAHSSSPHLGVNAIYHMAEVLNCLEDYAMRVAPQLDAHRLLGTPTLSVGLIAGGISVNTVPDNCTIEVDRRLLPNEDPRAARQHIIDFLAARLRPAVRIDHEEPFISVAGLADERNGQLAEDMRRAAQACGAPGEISGVPYGTDAPAFAAIGCPTIVFGPGSIEQAHTCDEWVAIEQLQAAADIYYQLGKQGLSA